MYMNVVPLISIPNIYASNAVRKQPTENLSCARQ